MDSLDDALGKLLSDPGAMAQVMGERGPVVEKLGGN